MVAVALDMVGFTMIIPDIQTRLDRMGADGWLIGAILASMFIVQTLASPRWGALSDRIGRKPVFLACQALSVASMVMYAVAGNVWFVLLSRVLAGLGAANVAVAQASLTAGLGGEDRTIALGRLSAATNAGLVLGPVVGGYVAGFIGSQQVGWIGACVSGIGLVAVALLVKMPQGDRSTKARKSGLKEIVRRFPNLVPLIALSAVAWFSLATLEGTFGRLLHHQWGYGEFEFGLIFAFESAVMLAAQAFIVPTVVKRFAERRILFLSLFGMGVGLGLQPFVPSLAFIFPLSLVYALGSAFASPTISSLASRQVSDDSQGEVFGAMQSARSLGFIVGPSLGGLVFDFWAPMPYVIAGAVCAAAGLFVPVATRQTANTA